MGRLTETVKHLIIINFLLWIATVTIGKNYGLSELLALHFPLNDSFHFWQVFTHMFMHSETLFMHILFNMLALFMFGSPLEQMWGRNKFLFFYLSAGLGGVILPLAVDYYNFSQVVDFVVSNGVDKNQILLSLNNLNYGDRLPEWTRFLSQEQWDKLASTFFQQGVGASGCVMGLLVAFGMSFPNAKLMLIFLPIPIKAKYFIPLVLAYEIISGFTGGTTIFGASINHFAHVGGALTGFIIMWYWRKNQFNQNRWDR